MKIIDFIESVLAVDSAGAATRFFAENVSRLREQGDPNPELTARANIGWCFGEGMSPERRAMWREACGASHPWLGPMVEDLTAEQIIRIGMELGRLAAGPK